MTQRLVVCILAGLLSGLPLSAAQATFEHAQKVATEITQRRAQIRAALCRQNVRDIPSLRLPLYPPVGTGGPVARPACAPR